MTLGVATFFMAAPITHDAHTLNPPHRLLSCDSFGAATAIVRERTPKSFRPASPPVTGTRRADRLFDAATAAPYIGFYYSDELGALYEVRRRDGRLVLLHPRLGELPLQDIGGDRFGIDGGGLVKATFLRSGDAMSAVQLEARSWGVTAWFRRVDLSTR